MRAQSDLVYNNMNKIEAIDDVALVEKDVDAPRGDMTRETFSGRDSWKKVGSLCEKGHHARINADDGFLGY